MVCLRLVLLVVCVCGLAGGSKCSVLYVIEVVDSLCFDSGALFGLSDGVVVAWFPSFECGCVGGASSGGVVDVEGCNCGSVVGSCKIIV